MSAIADFGMTYLWFASGESDATKAMIRKELPLKPLIALEEFNSYAAIADVDGMSWSDRCAVSSTMQS